MLTMGKGIRNRLHLTGLRLGCIRESVVDAHRRRIDSGRLATMSAGAVGYKAHVHLWGHHITDSDSSAKPIRTKVLVQSADILGRFLADSWGRG
jgi:hypothetical protein